MGKICEGKQGENTFLDSLNMHISYTIIDPPYQNHCSAAMKRQISKGRKALSHTTHTMMV